jgi:glucosylceramidase
MNRLRTRRDFLKKTAAGMTAAATWKASTGRAAGPVSQGAPTGTINVRVTDSRQKYALAPSLAWQPAAAVPSGEAIQLDPDSKGQEHVGIGGAFTDAACYVFDQLTPSARAELFHEMFDSSEMGLGAGRICIGSSDYARGLYSYDEGPPDPELQRFSIEHDRAYILPILREARKANPDLWLLASPWSPPGWMKPNNSMLGGCMRVASMRAYARYLLRFLQGYEAEGVPIDSVTSQNEVDAEQNGKMPACLWAQEQEIEFVGAHLGPLLRKNSAKTRIWILDHNYNLWGRAICCLDAPGVREYSNAVAWHGYAGTPDMMSRVHAAHPDAEMFWTEGGPDLDAKDYATDWSHWGETFTGILRNWCRCIIGWNLALDENGKPNIGPFRCGGMVTIHSQTHQVTRSGQFWAVNHFSRSIRRGARRFDSQAGPQGVSHAAYEHPDGRRVLLLVNPSASRSVEVVQKDAAVQVALGADSITTLEWKV